jgi:hypothetical protein
VYQPGASPWPSLAFLCTGNSRFSRSPARGNGQPALQAGGMGSLPAICRIAALAMLPLSYFARRGLGPVGRARRVKLGLGHPLWPEPGGPLMGPQTRITAIWGALGAARSAMRPKHDKFFTLAGYIC